MKEKYRRLTHEESSICKRAVERHQRMIRINDLDIHALEIKQKHWKAWNNKYLEDIQKGKNKRLDKIKTFEDITMSDQPELTQYELEIMKYEISNWDVMEEKFNKQIKEKKNIVTVTMNTLKADNEERLEIIRITEYQIKKGVLIDKNGGNKKNE